MIALDLKQYTVKRLERACDELDALANGTMNVPNVKIAEILLRAVTDILDKTDPG